LVEPLIQQREERCRLAGARGRGKREAPARASTRSTLTRTHQRGAAHASSAYSAWEPACAHSRGRGSAALRARRACRRRAARPARCGSPTQVWQTIISHCSSGSRKTGEMRDCAAAARQVLRCCAARQGRPCGGPSLMSGPAAPHGARRGQQRQQRQLAREERAGGEPPQEARVGDPRPRRQQRLQRLGVQAQVHELHEQQRGGREQRAAPVGAGIMQMVLIPFPKQPVAADASPRLSPSQERRPVRAPGARPRGAQEQPEQAHFRAEGRLPRRSGLRRGRGCGAAESRHGR